MENEMPKSAWPEWRLVKQLGRGSFATVYEAVRTDYNVESRAAVKIISIPQDDMDLDSLRTEGMSPESAKIYYKGILDDFVNEIKMMETFKGAPNIVTVEDYKVVERENGLGWDIYIRMELLTPLYAYVEEHPMNEQDVARLGRDICSALEICAKRNVIHRDVKPGNIFVDEFGYFKLGDFGIARKLENMTSGLSRKGTCNYMAPEVERGYSYDGRVDLYSLGLVLYQLMNNNRLPFLDLNKQILSLSDRQDAIRRRMNGENLPMPHNASGDMANIILCACRYDYKRRFANAAAMGNALEHIINGKNINGAGASKQAEAAVPIEHEIPIRQHTSQKRIPVQSEQSDAKQPETAALPKKKPKRLIAVILICVAAAAVVIAGFYMQERQRKEAEQYAEYVKEQRACLESEDARGEEEYFEKAYAINSSDIETLYYHAKALYSLPVSGEDPDYGQCMTFIDDYILFNDDIDLTQERMADVYYLYADCCFRQGEYENSISAYQKLFSIGTNETLYYYDYAVALAYDGQYSRAKEVLDNAIESGLADDRIYYELGIVEKNRADYDAALENFSFCISVSNNEELISGAYLARADIYSDQGNLEMAREQLNQAKGYETDGRENVLRQLISVDGKLYDASGDDEYCNEIIDAENTIINNGWESFDDYGNLVFYYGEMGDYDTAENILSDTKDSYGDNYGWYKRYAFLEVYKQIAKPEDEWDFTAFKSYYDKAKELYADYLANGGSTDDEMGVLDDQYEMVESVG